MRPPVSAAPEILTERLVLRPFRLADLDAYAGICADPEVMRHIGGGGPVGRDIAYRQMALHGGEWALRGYGTWAVERRHDGALLGRAGFLHPEGWPGAEMAWLLARAAWGQGYAREAVQAALAFGRRQAGLAAPISLIRPDNLRSVALAERLGARREAEIDFMGGPALQYRHA